ncbi:MAG: TonB family protein [Patescibacteria group bacterium]
MTNIVFVPNSGFRELRSYYKRNGTLALVIATCFHLAIISSYYLSNYFEPEEEKIATVRLIRYSELGPPPSITNTEAAPQVAVSVPVTKPTIGVPVPVPDAEVNPEQTIATQQEMSNVPSPTFPEGTGGNTGVDIKIEDDPDPGAFIPVEKQPVPVKQVSPEYPDLAKRASIEGTVWVKLLVDKEGKVRKVMIMKSDAEIFNEPALAAAKQWVFTPAMMNNGPVMVWAAIPFRFKLNK